MAPRKGAPVEPQMASLQFNEPLSWRAGKPIATGELLRRLDVLSNELREMDQEEVDKDSLTKVAKELAGQNLLGHKDKGVRAFTACCLVDVLKICAPDAPFTGTQLKDIFTLFITSILPALSDPSNTYNTQHKYVLVSLSEVKSIVLLMDIPNSDSLTLHLFSSFFDIASGSSKASTGEQIAKDVEYHMSQVLVTIVDEAANLPTEVVDIIVAQFLRAATPGGGKEKNGDTDEKQSTLLPKELPEAYNMAKTICNACPEKMARYISQYFNDVIMDASSNSKPNGHRRASDGAGSDDEDAPSGPTEQDLKELNKAHKLLRELWRASPAVLQNVIPQLEAELSAESVQLRSLSTETLGDIISGIGAAGPPPLPTWDPTVYPPVKLSEVPTSPVSSSILTTPISPQSFSQAHSQAYHAFIGRKNDKSSVVRSVWTTAVGRVLLTSAGGIGLSREDEASLVRGLGEKLNDAEERVRIAAVKAISSFSFYDIMAKIAPNGGVGKPGSVLNSLSDRVRDRKHTVQVEAMTTLSRIWWVAAGEIIEGNDAVVTALGAIPTKIFDAYYANDKQLNVLLGRVMFEQLIPLDYPATKAKGAKSTGESQKNGDSSFDADKIRTERILLIVKSLDAKSKKAFFALQARQSTFAQVLQTFLKQCETYNGGVVEGDTKEVKSVLDRVIKWLADFLPDPSKSIHDLNKYAKLHDRRSYQLLRYAMDPESDFKTVYKAIKEFRKRMKSSGTSDGLLDTLDPLIYCSSSLLYNKSHVPATMQYSKNDEMGLGATAQEVLKEISEKNPQTFKSQVKEICKLIEEQAPSATDANESGSMENLKICAGFARTSSSDLPQDRKFISTLTNFALYGTPPKAAKYAIQILMAVSNKKEMHAKELLDKSVSGWTYGEDHFLTKLATMSQLSLHDECITEEKSDEILDISTQKLLLEVRSPAEETDKSWQADSEVDEECQAKCWALKTLVNRLRAAKDPEVAKAIAAPIFKLLNLLIFKEGEIAKTKNTPKHHKSRLRLLAAQLMLKLCTTKLFDDLLMPTDFDRLALVTQDALANVRRGFIEKLQKYLVKEKLPHRFYTIIFLTAFEPDIDFKNSIITWIRSRAQVFQVKKLNVMEGTFPRLLSMLAHHPDFNPAAADLRDHARYLLHYLACVSSEGNIGLIYKYAERVKQARDAVNPAESDNLYVMSDLAQAAIRKWEEKKGWSMQAWPGKVGLPVGLFAALPSHAVAQDIAEKQYLPEDMDELLDSVVRSIDKKKKRKAVDDDGQPAAKKPKAEKPKSSSKASKKEKAPKPKTPARPKKSKPPRTPATDNTERRRSGRGTASKTYADVDDSEADQEMLDGVAEWEYLSQSGSALEDEEQGEAEVEDDDEPMEDVEVEEPVEDKSDENEEHEEPQPEPTPPPPRSNGRTATKRGAAKGKPKSKEIVEEEEDEIPTEQVDEEVLEEAEPEPESELSDPASSPPLPKSNGKTRGKRTTPAAKASASKANGKGKGKSKAKATPKKKEVVVEEVVEEEAEDDDPSDAPESEKEEEPEPNSEPEPIPPRTNGRATRGVAKSKAKPKAVKPKLVTPKAPVRASKPRGRGK